MRKHTLNAREDAEFRTLYKTGASTAAIAERFGMSIVVVRRLLRERDLDLPKPAAARNHARPSIDQQQHQAAYLARRTLKQEEEPWISPANRFRSQGLSTYNPDRS